jgi:hypothetical protein
MHACCCAVKRCLTRALLQTQLLGEEGSGTSSAVRRGGRPAVAAVPHRQESTTSLQRLAVHAHTQSAGERCVVGAVVAYACLLVLSGARAQPQGPRPCPLHSVQPRALRLRSAARTPHAARTRTTRDCCALPRRCCALGALCAVLRRFPPRVWKLRQRALTRPSCTTQLPWCSTSPTAPATRAACSSAPPGRAGERAAHGREGIYGTAPGAAGGPASKRAHHADATTSCASLRMPGRWGPRTARDKSASPHRGRSLRHFCSNRRVCDSARPTAPSLHAHGSVPRPRRRSARTHTACAFP